MTLNQFSDGLNRQSYVREYLIGFIDNLTITTSNTLKIQSTTLAQLTSSTNELTRKTLVKRISLCLNVISSRLILDIGISTMFNIRKNIETNVKTITFRRCSTHHRTITSMCNKSSHCTKISFHSLKSIERILLFVLGCEWTFTRKNDRFTI